MKRMSKIKGTARLNGYRVLVGAYDKDVCIQLKRHGHDADVEYDSLFISISKKNAANLASTFSKIIVNQAQTVITGTGECEHSCIGKYDGHVNYTRFLYKRHGQVIIHISNGINCNNMAIEFRNPSDSAETTPMIYNFISSFDNDMAREFCEEIGKYC